VGAEAAVTAKERAFLSIAPTFEGSEEAMNVLYRRVEEMAHGAFALQGKRAFETTLRAVAVHEAGHAVIHAWQGERVERVKVRRRRGAWVGVTEQADEGRWESTPTSPAVNDIDRAEVIISGFVTELLFDFKDMRAGSSLNEVAMFSMICANAALKLGADEGELKDKVLMLVTRVLLENGRTLQEVARRLEVRKTLRAKELAKLLSSVAPRSLGSTPVEELFDALGLRGHKKATAPTTGR
jgi:hypothetical protein